MAEDTKERLAVLVEFHGAPRTAYLDVEIEYLMLSLDTPFIRILQPEESHIINASEVKSIRIAPANRLIVDGE